MSFSQQFLYQTSSEEKTTCSLVHYLWSGSHSLLLSCVAKHFLLVLFNMPSLCCLQRQSHKGGPVGSCEKQGQARTKRRGGGPAAGCSLSNDNAVAPQVASGLLAAPSCGQLAGLYQLPSSSSGGLGLRAHAHSHPPALLRLAHPALPCSPLPCVIGSNCKSKSKQAILRADN